MAGKNVRCLMVISLVTVLVAGGCSQGQQITRQHPDAGEQGAVSPVAHQIALQKFIDGSLYEAKGEFAQAILEYQDALRYESNHAMYFALAKNYSALGKNPQAIEAGREAVRLQPDNLDYRRTLADVYLSGLEVDSAIGQYEEIVRRDSSDLTSWYNLARLYQPRRPLRALELYDDILARFGPEWDIYLQIADLCNRLGKFDRAAAALRGMLEIDPDNQDLKQSLAQAYVRAGKLDSALSVYTDLRSLNPDRLDFLVEIAGVHLMKKDYDRAGEEFKKILARDTVSLDMKLRIGEMYVGQMQKDSTLAPLTRSLLEQIRDAHPEDWRPYWFLGIVASATHDDSLAVKNFRKVTELASWNADGWVYLSSIYLEKNDFTTAEKILESAIKTVPDDFRVNFFLGVAYSRTGQEDDALRVLQRAHQINPKDVDAVAQLALVYDGMKRFTDSDSLYEEALSLNPENDLVLNNYGYSLAERGIKLDRALEMARKAVSAKPDNPSYLDTYGWVNYRLGNFEEAEKYIRKAVDKGEVSAVVYEHLGDTEFRLHNKREALEMWTKALELDAKNDALRAKIARGSL